ncbi:unnamed protein product [Paramecium sonneborni]|uniref:Uncharacterized protein n=1 Tax=Paramecium sonneborni TaxID=65129 RepID=A0A8S1RQ23_9CILI|nr:unnamed protein product [Paramecium sonneborni]
MEQQGQQIAQHYQLGFTLSVHLDWLATECQKKLFQLLNPFGNFQCNYLTWLIL